MYILVLIKAAAELNKYIYVEIVDIYFVSKRNCIVYV